MGTTANLYVVLPRYEDDRPEVFTGILAGAPYAEAEAITLKADHTIALAKQAEPDETRCGECGVNVGYRFESRHSDPEEFVIDGFYVTPDGTVLCEECGDPDKANKPAPYATPTAATEPTR